MIVAGTYEDGKITLSHPLPLRHQRVEVKVDIPDAELFDPLESVSDEGLRSMVKDIRSLRGYDAGPGSGLSDQQLIQHAMEQNPRERNSGD